MTARPVWPVRVTPGSPRPPGGFVATCDDDDEWHPGTAPGPDRAAARPAGPARGGVGHPADAARRQDHQRPARPQRISQQLLTLYPARNCSPSRRPWCWDAVRKAGLDAQQTPNGYAEDYDFILRVARVGRIGGATDPARRYPEAQRFLVAGQCRRDRRGPRVPAGQAPGDRGVTARARPPARADRVLAIAARPARAGAAVRGWRPGQVACVAARIPGAGAHRDRRGPQARAARCAPGWNGAWPSPGQRKKRGEFHDVRAQGRTRTGPAGPADVRTCRWARRRRRCGCSLASS